VVTIIGDETRVDEALKQVNLDALRRLMAS
jgi:hypothetical protein